MEDTEQRYMQLMQKELEEEKIRRMQIQNEYSQSNSTGYKPDQDKSLAEMQLDLDKLLDRIHHLLRGDYLGRNLQGNECWLPAKDDRLIIFSEYGINRIMNVLSFYLSTDILLSNFDEETIKWKLKDFANELSDLIYTQYELFFSYPTPEALYEFHYPQLRRNNIGITDEELYLKCVRWSREEMQLKIRNYPMTVQSIVDIVHATYLRALNGEERTSLRKMMQIHQSANLNQQMEQPQKPGIFNWGKK